MHMLGVSERDPLINPPPPLANVLPTGGCRAADGGGAVEDPAPAIWRCCCCVGDVMPFSQEANKVLHTGAKKPCGFC